MSDVTTGLINKSNAELLKIALLGGKPISVSQLQSYYYDNPRQILDPIAIASEQQDPRFLAASLAIQREIEQRNQQLLDPGSVALDILARRMQIPANISSFRQTKNVLYPIASGVTYHRDPVDSKVGGPGRFVEFVSFNDTPMMDWDLPGDFHSARNVSVRHLGDVEELVREHLHANPQSSLMLYQTPGGYRAWELSQRLTPQGFGPQAEGLKVDPDYIMIAQQGNQQVREGLAYGGPKFSARVSDKPGRPGDWVAQPLLALHGAEAMPDPESLRRISRYHDEPIRRHFLDGNGASPGALLALEKQASTASTALQSAFRKAGLLR